MLGWESIFFYASRCLGQGDANTLRLLVGNVINEIDIGQAIIRMQGGLQRR